MDDGAVITALLGAIASMAGFIAAMFWRMLGKAETALELCQKDAKETIARIEAQASTRIAEERALAERNLRIAMHGTSLAEALAREQGRHP